jgi:hypothetical protein
MYWILFFLLLGGWYLYPIPQEKEVKEYPYENLYMLGCSAEESEDLKELGVVEETTPEGVVRMKFVDGVFMYWANRSIQYKYLETVARKYVIVYDCKEKYINIFKELAYASLKTKPKPEEMPSVFVSFKQYNTKQNQLYSDVIVNEKANQYVWKGKLSEYDPPVHQEVKPIRYSDFKKM